DDGVVEKEVVGTDDHIGAGGTIAEAVVPHQAVANDAVVGGGAAGCAAVVVNVYIAAIVVADVTESEVVGSALLEENAVADQVVAIIELGDAAAGGRIAVHAVLVDVADFGVADDTFDATELKPDAAGTAPVERAAGDDVGSRAVVPMDDIGTARA